jgi:hypothetical protein
MHPFLDSIDVSTRKKRRKAVVLAIELLKKIRYAEEQYMARVPRNLHSGGAYFASDDSIDAIAGALISLLDAY